MGDKIISICVLMLFISVYRGLFFDSMFARRQFYAICRSMGKGSIQSWERHSVADEAGITSYTDDAVCTSFLWADITAAKEDSRHIDIYAGDEVVRFEKDSFTAGTGAEFILWLEEKLPNVTIERGKPLYLS